MNCPDVLTFDASQREFLLNHDLVRNGHMILQVSFVCVYVFVCVIENYHFQQTEPNRINIYACFINIQVSHEVKNQLALAKKTSQIMKN